MSALTAKGRGTGVGGAFWLGGWPTQGSLNTVYKFNPLPYLNPFPQTHTHLVPSRAPSSIATTPWEPAQRGGDSVPGAGAAPSGQEGSAEFPLPSSLAPPGSQFTLTSWICLPGPRLPLACLGIQGCNQPVPYLPVR